MKSRHFYTATQCKNYQDLFDIQFKNLPLVLQYSRKGGRAFELSPVHREQGTLWLRYCCLNEWIQLLAIRDWNGYGQSAQT